MERGGRDLFSRILITNLAYKWNQNSFMIFLTSMGGLGKGRGGGSRKGGEAVRTKAPPLILSSDTFVVRSTYFYLNNFPFALSPISTAFLVLAKPRHFSPIPVEKYTFIILYFALSTHHNEGSHRRKTPPTRPILPR